MPTKDATGQFLLMPPASALQAHFLTGGATYTPVVCDTVIIPATEHGVASPTGQVLCGYVKSQVDPGSPNIVWLHTVCPVDTILPWVESAIDTEVRAAIVATADTADVVARAEAILSQAYNAVVADAQTQCPDLVAFAYVQNTLLKLLLFNELFEAGFFLSY